MQSLRVHILRTILAALGALTALIAVVMFYALNERLEADLTAQAVVVGRALQQSSEVPVGARNKDRSLVERGLGWLEDVGEDLVFVVVYGPDDKPLAGWGRDGVLGADELQDAATRPLRFMEIEQRPTLKEDQKAAAAGDILEAIEAEQPAAPAVGDGHARIVFTRENQLVRQTTIILGTGFVLGAIALALVWWLLASPLSRLEPAVEQARRMSQGDFSQEIVDEQYRELSALFHALNEIAQSLSRMIGDVRGMGDEIAGAGERIGGAAGALRNGADQGTRAVSVTEGAVAAMQRTVEESARHLTELASTADASSRDTETIERTNSSTVASVLALAGEVDRHAGSLAVIGDRVRALSADARSVAESSSAARAAAGRMQKTAQEGTARASEAARLADGAMRDSQVGGKAIEDAVARIQEIATYAGTMEGNLRALTERVEGMNPVLGAIADVTSRTSLLALNAGIIAAQAGERGAAFQVVVDELKSLAARTAQLTSAVEESVRTVLEQRGRTDEAAEALQRVVAASIEDAHRAGAALDAIRASTSQSQSVSANIADTLAGQERDVRETLQRIDVVDNSGKSVEATARALADEVRVLREVADRVTVVSEDVAKASRDQGELAQRVGQVLALVSEQVRDLSSTQAAQHTDVARVERSLGEIRRFADDARAGATQLESIVGRMQQKAAGLSEALHRFRTRN